MNTKIETKHITDSNFEETDRVGGKCVYKKDDYYLRVFDDEMRMHIWYESNEVQQTVFLGTVKTETEFRILLKMLG